MIEFCPFDHSLYFKHDVFITSGVRDNDIWEAIFTTNNTPGKAVKGLMTRH